MNKSFKQTIVLMSEFLGDIHLGEEEITRDAIVDMILILEKNIEDFRVVNRTIFNLYDILIIVFLAILSGYSNASAFEHFCKRNYYYLESLGLLTDEIVPSHDTFRRTLMLLNPIYLEKALNIILNNFFKKVEKYIDDNGKLTHVAIDGKELRGTGRSNDCLNPKKNIQTLNVYNVTNGICMFSRVIDEKTNEIPVAQELLKPLNLRNVLVSGDALHTQVLTSEIITANRGYYLFNVKDNQSLLKMHIEQLFNKPKNKKVLSSSVIYDEKSKKEKIYFFYKISRLEKDDDFKNKKYYVKYLNGIKAKPIYFVTSLNDPNSIVEGINRRWEIENNLHRNKDMLLHEDYIRYTNKNIAANLVVFNNFALTFIKIFKDLFGIERVKYARIDLTNSKTDILKTIKLISQKNIKFEFKSKK